jgi:hypothetical protein
MTDLKPMKIRYDPQVYESADESTGPKPLYDALVALGVSVYCHNLERHSLGVDISSDCLEAVKGLEGVVSVTDDFQFGIDGYHKLSLELDRPEVMEELLGKYTGVGYSLGVMCDPETPSRLVISLHVEGEDLSIFPKQITIDGEKYEVRVEGGFVPPTAGKGIVAI